MENITLYHGSTKEHITPTFGVGVDRHDYGRGFYLTEDIELAKEWSASDPVMSNGWVHKYLLNIEGLLIYDFSKGNILSWLAELMKHRNASESRRYHVLSKKFIEEYGIDVEAYDVIKGWRADASFFYIAKAFVRDEIDEEILEELLSLGGLGIQYCFKSEKAFSNLKTMENDIIYVDYKEFNQKYSVRDSEARENMRMLINSDKNKVTNVFSTLISEGGK